MTRIVEAAGASAICIHGRTRAQGYKGPANWDFIRQSKEAAKRIPVIGYGDAFDPGSVQKMFEQTGCDAVLLARGTMGKPWLIEDIYRHFSGLPPLVHSGRDYCNILLEHLDHIVSYQDERRALLDLRRVGCWFLKGGKGMRHLRESLNRSQSIAQIRQMICDYSWDEVDLSESSSMETAECSEGC